MLRHILSTTILICMLLAVSGCHSKSDSPAPPAPESVHRTVLVYMLADNNLGSALEYDDADLKEMAQGVREGGLNGGRLLVYHNRPGTDRGMAPQLLEITEQGTRVLKTYPDDPGIYSVAPSRMSEVLADTKTVAPAEDYGIVFWGHSTSWMTENGDYTRTAAPPMRSYGYDRTKWMSLASMRETLENERFSFIYFDCCLMGTVEVAYELRHITPVIAASPTELEGEGMPYHLNIAPFFVSGTPDVVQAARNTFKYYNTGSSGRCQMTVIETAGLDALAEASKAIFRTHTSYPAGLSSVQALSKRFNPTSALYSQCRPVYDMDHYMETLCREQPELLDAWREALAKTVSYKATTSREYNGILVSRYCGLGSYIVMAPGQENYRDYTECSWWKDVVSAAPLFDNSNNN
ncbi:MAG: clostripain-related cysteine peptidase [Staphylococcus sp.]|nr:clostripain-related cysteine peptidase [Staphylococcus sp.]